MKIYLFLGILWSGQLLAQGTDEVFQSPLQKSIDQVALSADGKTVAATDVDGYLFFWERSSGSLSWIIRPHNKKLTSFDLSADGEFFATTAGDAMIQLWNSKTGAKISTLNLPASCPKLMFSTDSKSLLYVSGNSIYKTDLSDITQQDKIFTASSSILAAESNAAKDLLAIGEKNQIHIIDLKKMESLASSGACSGEKKVSFEENHVATACANGVLELFRFEENNLRKTAGADAPKSFNDLLKLPGQENVVLIRGNAHPIVWLAQSDTFIPADGFPDKISALEVLNEKQLLAGTSSGTVMIIKNIFFGGEEKPQEKEPEKPKEISSIELTEAGMPSKLNNRPVKVHQHLDVSSEELEILIWDHETEDGDIVSLNLNGTWILENYEVVKQKKKLNIKLDPAKDNYMILYAHNVGQAPPNTAAVSFNDGKTEQVLTLKSDLKYSDAVRLILKK